MHARHVLARTTRVSTQQSCGGCAVEDTGRTLLLVSPHDCQLLLPRPSVCWLGPPGTQSAPPASILDSAGLWRPRHEGHRLHAASRPASRLLAALASSLRPTSRRPAALAVAQRVPAQPTRDIKRTACLDSPRLTSRLLAALAAARRVLARPVRDMERTAYLGSRLGAVVAAPPRAQVPTTCHCHISPSDSCGGPA